MGNCQETSARYAWQKGHLVGHARFEHERYRTDVVDAPTKLRDLPFAIPIDLAYFSSKPRMAKFPAILRSCIYHSARTDPCTLQPLHVLHPRVCPFTKHQKLVGT